MGRSKLTNSEGTITGDPIAVAFTGIVLSTLFNSINKGKRKERRRKKREGVRSGRKERKKEERRKIIS